jgi:hypothetical protein
VRELELYTPVLALLILAGGFAVFSVIMSAVVGPKRYNRAKLDSYECGIEPTPQPVGGGLRRVRVRVAPRRTRLGLRGNPWAWKKSCRAASC